MFRNAFRVPGSSRGGSLRMFVFLWVAFMALFVAGWVNGARGHSWYPASCCSSVDCYPVPVKQVVMVPGGWLVEGNTFIPYAMARPSPDGHFHICRNELGKGTLITPAGEPACFWAPMGAS